MPEEHAMYRFVPPNENSTPSQPEPQAVPLAPNRDSVEVQEQTTSEKHHSSDETAVEIVDNVMRASHRLRAILNSHLGQFELTDIRYAVLQAIRETASHGCSQKELSTKLNQTESSISTLIERMRQSGLLYRLPSTVDRRRKVLLLSELGRETLVKAEEFHSRRMAALLTCFQPPERNTFSRLLKVWVEELTQLPADAARASISNQPAETEPAPLSFPYDLEQKPAA